MTPAQSNGQHRASILLALFTTIITAIVMTWNAAPAGALERMSDTELEAVTGQAGFAGLLSAVTGMDIHQGETVLDIGWAADPSRDKNGAWLSMADIGYDGTFRRSLAEAGARVSTDSNGHTLITMDQTVLMDVKNFHASFRLGTEPGAGDTLGALHIASLTATVSGTIRIFQVQPGI